MKWIRRKPVVLVVVALAVILSVISTAQGQGGQFGGIMTYDPANKWVLFTDHTGTWHAPMAFHNAAAPNTSITEITVNTDDQFAIETFHLDQLAAVMTLDTNGGAALVGSNGGGIGADGPTGDTCIPASLTTSCTPVSLHVAANGILTKYRGQALDGNGVSTILFHADSTLTGAFGPYTVFTTNASGYASGGMYRLSGYMTALNTEQGSTMQFVLGYADETGTQVQTTPTVPFAFTGGILPFTFVFYAQPATPITITAVTTTGQNYSVHLRLEAL